MPRVSVIIPCYNCGGLLPGCLQSILSQTYPHFEVLVMDGASQDETLNVVKRFAALDERVKWYSEKDTGLYEAMNKGIAKSTGEWLFFLGSDDKMFDDQVLAKVAAAIEQSPGTKLLYGNVQLSRPLGYYHQGLIYAGRFDSEKLLNKNLCHQSVFYHCSVFNDFGYYNTNYPVLADYDFNLRCFNRVKSHFVNLNIAHFNVDGVSSSSQSQDPDFFNDFLENMAVRYSYSFTSKFFDGRKKELLRLLIKSIRRLKIGRSGKLIRILAWQLVRRTTKRVLGIKSFLLSPIYRF